MKTKLQKNEIVLTFHPNLYSFGFNIHCYFKLKTFLIFLTYAYIYQVFPYSLIVNNTSFHSIIPFDEITEIQRSLKYYVELSGLANEVCK